MGYPTKRQLCVNVNRANMITDGLQLCHYFSENGSEIITDCSGVNEHMSVGVTSAPPVVAASEYGSALQWDNTANQRLECTVEDYTRFGSQGTVFFRMKIVSPVTTVGAIALALGGATSGEANDGFLWIVPYTSTINRIQFGYRDDGASATTVGFITDTSDAFDGDTWHDFFITGDGSAYAAYKDEDTLSLTSLGGGAYKWLGDIDITAPVKRAVGMRYRGGAWAYTGEFTISELRVYNRVLTATEMKLIRSNLG